MTNAEKGIYGEHVGDVYMANRGYSKVNDGGRLTQVGDAPRGTGIDGVYKNLNPPPEYVIADSKYATDPRRGPSRLEDTADGKQMSDTWIQGSDRLTRAVGRTEAINVQQAMNRNTVERQLHVIDPKGQLHLHILDANGNVITGQSQPPVSP